MDSDAGALLRYRRHIGADEIRIFCDIKKKHSAHATTADLSIAETAEAAEFFRADGVIVTGSATGKPVDMDQLASVRRAVKIPVIVGSGVTPEQIPALCGYADALIVGSYVKQNGRWDAPLDPSRVQSLAREIRKLQK